ncbi:MAG: hypothetical protein ACR2O3_06365 [Rhizobiaceae bacterium]
MIKPELGIPENCGSVTISFDFEIGWGDVTNQRWRHREKNGVYKRLRQVLPVILDEMDRLEFPAVWATVGALFDNPDTRDFSHLPHDAQNQINAVLNESESESFNGHDLFELVLGSRVSQHIACHTYSHVPFTWQGMSDQAVIQDLERFNSVLKRFGLATDRFVYPENREKFADAVLKSGFAKARVSPPNMAGNRWLRLAKSALFAPPFATETGEDGELVRHTGSMLFHDAGKSWRRQMLTRRVELGIAGAIEHKKCMHLWAHPFNFAESESLLMAFLETLRKLARARDNGQLVIALM